MIRRLAVIGTAGRDKSKPMTARLWAAMAADLQGYILSGDLLVSGGAAWADHLAVHAFLQGWVDGLRLYMPAPFTSGKFVGPSGSAASAANYYHDLFQAATGLNSLAEIGRAIDMGAAASFEPVSPGYDAMFARNKKVAQACNACVAYTFGCGVVPADGGTLDTWKKISASDKRHVGLGSL